jgi:LmbE family N-acetylglucosaminyl deacetylase
MIEAKQTGSENHLAPDHWEKQQKILVVLAHPDDPEFFCGATIARWTQAGHQVNYCLLTCGDKGTKDRNLSSEELCKIRKVEQLDAAKILGVSQVRFLNYPDGYLIPDLNLRCDITRVIRQERPDILVTCDPQTLYVDYNRLNHPDHRAAGQATLDAVYPAARDHLYFSELLNEEKLEPHSVSEVWVSGAQHPNVVLDVTDTWEIKILALQKHVSQIGEAQAFVERMRARIVEDCSVEHPRYEEKFIRLVIGQ